MSTVFIPLTPKRTQRRNATTGSAIRRQSKRTCGAWMGRPSRLPGKTECLSSCFLSRREAPSKPCYAARGAQPSSADPAWHCGIRGIAMANATMHDINEIKRRMQGASSVLKTELSGLRTGRASAHLLDPVMVDAYGAQMPLNQVATVSVPEPRLISVNVWDRSLVHPVEKAIINSNLGLSPATEGQTIRLRIPELNEERRKELVKVAHKYA